VTSEFWDGVWAGVIVTLIVGLPGGFVVGILVYLRAPRVAQYLESRKLLKKRQTRQQALVVFNRLKALQKARAADAAAILDQDRVRRGVNQSPGNEPTVSRHTCACASLSSEGVAGGWRRDASITTDRSPKDFRPRFIWSLTKIEGQRAPVRCHALLVPSDFSLPL
jgi:hypothetical protein